MELTPMTKNSKKRKREARPNGRVSHVVRKYLRASKSPSTVRAYLADLQHFNASGFHVPERPERVAKYLAQLADERTFSTVKRRAAAITAAHRELGYASPCHSDLVRSTLKGISRMNPGSPNRVRPLLAAEVQRAARGLKGLKGLRERAMLMLGFAGAFRRSELVAIDVEDLTTRGRDLVVTLWRSKTDQNAAGRQVVVPRGPRGRCPVEAVQAWLRASAIREGPVFRRLTRYGDVTQMRLDPAAVCAAVKRCAAALGLDPKLYGGHSLRSGYVTTAALQGMPLWQVRLQTGHKRDSTVECYVRVPASATTPRLL
jgi:integrase